jgi:predicted phage-related endonuclease
MSRAEWLESRRAGIGASDVAAVLGLGAYGSPAAVWASKVGEIDDSPPSGLAAMGLDIEPYALAEVGRRLGVDVVGSQEVVISDACPHLRATVDGIIETETERIPVECKFITCDAFTWGDDPALDWDALGAWLEDDTKPFPVSTRAEAAYVQINAQMVCSGASHGYLAAVMGARAGYLLRIGEKIGSRDLRVLHVPADLKLQAAICSAIPAFWELHVETKKRPPGIGPKDLDAIKRHLRSSRAGSAEDMPQLASIARELNAARGAGKLAADTAKGHEANLRAALLDVEVAIAGDWTITAKTNARGARPIRLKESKP